MNTPHLSTAESEAVAQGFEVLYQEYRDLIYRYVYCWVGNREDAEDVTSQVFLKAWRGVDVQRSPRAIRKWLFQVARTTIADYWRERSRVPTCSLEGLLEAADWDELDQEESRTIHHKSPVYIHRILPRLSTRSPEELLGADQDDPGQERLRATDSGSAGCVHSLLQALPEQYREVLICRFLHGLSIKETALRMGLTVANVKVIQFRALKRAASLGHSAIASGDIAPHQGKTRNDLKTRKRCNNVRFPEMKSRCRPKLYDKGYYGDAAANGLTSKVARRWRLP